jgi:hypothetical protein
MRQHRAPRSRLEAVIPGNSKNKDSVHRSTEFSFPCYATSLRQQGVKQLLLAYMRGDIAQKYPVLSFMSPQAMVASGTE